MSTRIACPTFILLVFTWFVAVCTAQDVSTAPGRNPIIFPQDHETFYRTISSTLHLVGVSVLAYCLSRRTDRLASRGLTSHALTRWLVILIFIDSWLFIFISGILVSGVGLSLNEYSCTAGVVICISLYAASKLMIYWFLAEKVYFVHRRTPESKLRSPAYRICMVFVLGYVGVIVLAVYGRISFLRNGHQTMVELMGPVGAGDDNQCVIGIGRYASITLLIYDLLLNVFFTCMFLYPVYRSSKLSPGLKAIAQKTLIAALVALATSAINICILMIMHGRELGWICLASCGCDIIVNAVAIYVATSFVDDVPDHNSPPVYESTTEKKQIRFAGAISKGLRKVVPSNSPILPITNVGVTSSTRGILETSNSRGAETTTRSVHFSPEVTGQNYTITGYDTDLEPAIGDISLSNRAPERRNAEPSSSSRPLNAPSMRASSFPRRSTISSAPEKRQMADLNMTEMALPIVDLSDSNDSNETLTRRLPAAIYLHLIDVPPLGEPEDTTLEIRQEGRLSRNPRKRPPCLVSMAVAHARRRSKSVDSRNEEQSSRVESRVLQPANSLSEPPSSVDEARARLRVISALMDITRGKRQSQTAEGLLEVSVVTQTDRRIELRKKRDDLVDDYNGRKYDRRGRSASSSGGL